MNTALEKVISFLGSKTFFWIVVAFFALNALWIALSLHTLIYDENFHYSIIKSMANSFSPLATHPDHAINGLRSLDHSGKPLLYHYLMSFPYRVFAYFVQNVPYQIVFLRVLNVAMAAVGLWLFAKVFQTIGVKRIFINTGLLLFVLVPIVPYVAANINYDNMLFPLTAWYLLLCIYLIKNRQVNWLIYTGIAVVGCFASLVKPTFLPVFAASAIYLIILIWRRHGKQFFGQFWESVKKTRKYTLTLMVAMIIVFVGLFSAVYIRNVVQYGALKPKCGKALSTKQCEKVPVQARNMRFESTKSQRSVESLESFSTSWFRRITAFSWVGGSDLSGRVSSVYAPAVLSDSMALGVVACAAVLLYAWRSLRKNTSWYFLLTMAVILIAAVYYVNVKSYYFYHANFANQPRYLLSVMPIVIVMSVVAFNFILRKARWAKLALLLVVLLLFTQGGGAVTTIIKSNDTWYWQSPKVIKANHAAKKVLQPMVKEGQLLK